MKSEQSSEAFWLDRRIHFTISLPFLALVAPFTFYITDQGVSLMSPEVWAIFAGMFCVSVMIGLLRRAGRIQMYAISVGGLLTVAADYLFEWVTHGPTIMLLVIFGALVTLVWRFEKPMTMALTAFLGVFVGSTLLQNGLALKPNPVLTAESTEGMLDSPPRLIHLIVDEHLGIEGFPDDTDYDKELKREIKQFYQRYGFKLYGGAYSHYYETMDSIPNLVNFSAESVNHAFITGLRPPYVLQQNRYFQFLERERYQIHVVDGDYLDFCSSPEVRIHSCMKYQWHSLANMAKLDLPVLTKTTVLLATFVKRYGRYQSVLNSYEQRLRPFLLSGGVAVPAVNHESLWTKRRLEPLSVNAMAVMDELTASILHLAPGHMLFAHLLLPHYPYVFREDCSPRAIQESLDNMEEVPLELRTIEERRVRFDQYLRQVECLYVRLDEIFKKMQASGVFDSTIIILHGDHGARLGLHFPKLKEQNQLTTADYADGLSTLFAVKVPGKSGGYDPSLHAIDELLVETLGRAFGNAPPLSAQRREPFAYLRAGVGKEQLLVDMPWRPLGVPESRAVAQ